MTGKLEALSEKLFSKKLEDASDEQVYVALLYLVKGLEEATVPNDGDKKIYYISAEFLTVSFVQQSDQSGNL